jgi:hypothetical protein
MLITVKSATITTTMLWWYASWNDPYKCRSPNNKDGGKPQTNNVIELDFE